MASTPAPGDKPPADSAAKMMSPPDSLILVSQSGPVRQLSLNRPAALNSFTAAMHEVLLDELDAAANDDDVRCVVITGCGRAFCAGQDLNEPSMQPVDGQAPDVGAVIERHYLPLAKRLQAMPVPLIAAVNGVAAGAGANMALNCDMVVAARSASFIQAFSKIGLVPDCGGTWLLPRLIGRARAMGLAFLGDKLSAEEAERMGLIWQCVDDGELESSVLALAQRLAAMPARALVNIRQTFDAAQHLDYEQALRNEADVQRELSRSRDFTEGVSAFQAKRQPHFTDR